MVIGSFVTIYDTCQRHIECATRCEKSLHKLKSLKCFRGEVRMAFHIARLLSWDDSAIYMQNVFASFFAPQFTFKHLFSFHQIRIFVLFLLTRKGRRTIVKMSTRINAFSVELMNKKNNFACYLPMPSKISCIWFRRRDPFRIMYHEERANINIFIAM